MNMMSGAGTVDFSEQIRAIKAKYGPRYHFEPKAFAAARTLWGATSNEHGVLQDVTEFIEVTHKKFRVEIRLCRTSKNYWLIGLSFSSSSSGFATPPSIWDKQGFTSFEDARSSAAQRIINHLKNNTQSCPNTNGLQSFIQKLESLKVPQMSLF